MPELKKGKDCCGCTACAAVCPKDAISMLPDSLGFKYPEVDASKCVECGACERVCSFNDEYLTPDNYSAPRPFGARMKEIKEVMKSRSGGAFVALSDWILDNGGVVYGAGYKDHFVVAHKRAATKEQRDEFRGSKYVQSDLDGIFKEVKSDLAKGLTVLFSGTACQVAGLSSYIPKNLKERLVTVDIVCHGVPSPYIWRDYLAAVEGKENSNAVGVNFRDKEMFGWKDHKESFAFIDNRTQTRFKKSFDEFTYMFYQHIMLRPSCGNCHFCNLRRPADITLADFWGWERTGSLLNADDKGLSLVLVNTEKGISLFNAVKEKMYEFEPILKDCMQIHFSESTKCNPLSVNFQRDYEKHGFKYVWKKYGNTGMRYKLKVLKRKFKTASKLLLGIIKKEK